MSLNDRARTLNWLRSCSEKDLADLFDEAVSSRVTEESPAFRTHYVLGLATHDMDTGSWSLSVVNQPASDESAWAPDSPLSQEGRCGECLALGVSWAKSARCAVCGAEVYGT